MAIGAVLCLSLMLSGCVVAFPSVWLTSSEVSPGKCASKNLTKCCQGNDTECTVRGRGVGTCYCDRGCHERDDCCDDIGDIGCPAQCADAKLTPGRCHGPTPSACRARPHTCYCDGVCNDYCDCCNDVPNGCQRPNSLSSIQYHPITRYPELDVLKDAETMKRRFNNGLNDAEAMERRLLHYLISSQRYQRRLAQLLIAQSEDVDDAKMLERRLLQYLTSSQSYRRRPTHLPMAQDLEVELLERALADRTKELTPQRKQIN